MPRNTIAHSSVSGMFYQIDFESRAWGAVIVVPLFKFSAIDI